MSRAEERERLLRNLERSRRKLDRRISNVSHSLDVSERIGRSVKDNAGVWIGGGVLAGMLLAFLTATRGGSRSDEDDGTRRGRGDLTVSRLFGPIIEHVVPLLFPAFQALAIRGIEHWLRADSRRSESAKSID
jgi:hypothetical protein